MASLFTIQLRLRMSIPTQLAEDIAMDIELSDLHFGNETALLCYFESLSRFPQFHHIDRACGIERVIWPGINAPTVLETLDRIWMKRERAIVYVTAVPDSVFTAQRTRKGIEGSSARKESGETLGRHVGDGGEGGHARSHLRSSQNTAQNETSSNTRTQDILPNGSEYTAGGITSRSLAAADATQPLEHPTATASRAAIESLPPSSADYGALPEEQCDTRSRSAPPIFFKDEPTDQEEVELLDPYLANIENPR